MASGNGDVVRGWWAGFNEDGMPPAELIDERIEIGMFEGFLVQGPFHGHDGVRSYVEQVFEVIDEARVEVDEVIEGADGETVLSVQRVLGHTRHTRLPVDFQWSVVWTVRDGKVARGQGYLARAEALEAMP